MREAISDAFRLMMTLKSCVSPFHAVKYAEDKLTAAGFDRLNMYETWNIEKGGKYFVNVYDTTLFAFTVGQNFDYTNGIRIAAAHTDWPCLRIKPNPETERSGYAALNVEVYGSPILNTWLDRPLGIAGRVTVKGENSFNPESRLVDFKRGVLTIPNLAIHLNRDVNKGTELNKQTDMLPLAGMIADELSKDGYFIKMLAEEVHVKPEDILFYDLCVYNTDASQTIGMQSDFISSPRIDNISGVEACLNGILASDNSDTINVAVLYDNEEIGSRTKQGAGSVITDIVLENIMTGLGFSRDEYLSSLFKSLMLSVDVAHGVHPYHPEKYDITSKTVLNSGVAVKTNANQSYATDGNVIGIIKSVCDKNEIPYQVIANRSDIVGGSTLGSIASAFTAIRTVDVGIPVLAMHSARELMGIKDMAALNELTERFYND